MGEHQLTIRDHLRRGNPSATNKYLQAVSGTRLKTQQDLVEAILPVQLKVTTIASTPRRFATVCAVTFCRGATWPRPRFANGAAHYATGTSRKAPHSAAARLTLKLLPAYIRRIALLSSMP
jgi:hypothetical protein